MTARLRLDALRQTPQIAPSLLLCDFGNLEREVRRLEAAQVQVLHLDVMDGHFVPNLTYGPPIVAAIRKLTSLFLDVHLMIERPDRFLASYAEAGADLLTVHVEAVANAPATLQQIRGLGLQAGLALNPETSLSAVEPVLSSCDLLLVMSVKPGFGGQKFQPVALEKLRRVRSLAGPDLVVEVDGGINEQTLGACREAGAGWFVVGSAIFLQDDYAAAVRNLASQAAL